MARTKWLDRTLVQGPSLCLCLSEAQYAAAAKHCGWPTGYDDAGWAPEGGARVHSSMDGPNPVAIVCMNAPDASEVMAAGLLAHEAVHIWQDWLRLMHEDAPGDEISAYAVQNLVVLLMDEWVARC